MPVMTEEINMETCTLSIPIECSFWWIKQYIF